ncbi:hypothetical protein CERZMDRAFT_93567 [Cercospora zeae-maydis SCOH1-5]|uniref:Uncharacterized protein n=1 Tax=Cercospora zeae-maydis SCOH1-5 TaxID=717836 RepID=A0A6A6FS01_9PEZI|nr:hypothetical protein CERZMDRAFT_93567 [Cercospora zeae-maydis SCOH1-5]
MPLTALAIPLPITPTIINSHPALQFYAIYGQNFPTTASQWQQQPPNYWEAFYAADCKTFLVDGTVLTTGEASWEYFRTLYSRFPKVERELKSGIVVSSSDQDEDDEVGGGGKYKNSIHVELTTKLFPSVADEGDDDVVVAVELPQSFVYVLGKADEKEEEEDGKGTLGLQIRELRNYYDLRTLEGALEGKDERQV